MGRLRTNPNAATEIKLSPFLIQNTKTIGFKNNIILEIGCGKGDFIIENALKFPENNYIGVEKYATVLLKAIKKISILTTPPTNIKFILGDFQEIYPDLKPHSITKIFLNFSDPWPKKHHEKFRLTNLVFLKMYHQLLIADALLEIKTDNVGLYEYSYNTLKDNKGVFDIIDYCQDLYTNEKMMSDNIQTEYEKKFVLQNKKICKIVAKNKH